MTNLSSFATAARLATASLIAATVGNAPAIGQEISQDVGASQRITLAAEIGILSVNHTVATCNLIGGIATDLAKDVLETGKSRYEVLDAALTEGNADLGVIGPETRRQNLTALSDLREKWIAFIADADQAQPASQDVDAIKRYVRWDGQLRQDANTLLVEISGSYGDTIQIQQPEAMRLQLVGNAKLSAARISRNVCALSAGVKSRRLEDELENRTLELSSTLQALAKGMPVLNIAPPPTEEIATKIAEAQIGWQAQAPIVDILIAGQSLSTEDQEAIFRGMTHVNSQLAELSTLYADHASR